MLDLLLKALIGILIIAVVWYVASMLLPAPLPIVIALVVAVLVLAYLLRGRVNL